MLDAAGKSAERPIHEFRENILARRITKFGHARHGSRGNEFVE